MIVWEIDDVTVIMVQPPVYTAGAQYRGQKPLTEVRCGIVLPDGDRYIARLPVFTDWWE